MSWPLEMARRLFGRKPEEGSKEPSDNWKAEYHIANRGQENERVDIWMAFDEPGSYQLSTAWKGGSKPMPPEDEAVMNNAVTQFLRAIKRTFWRSSPPPPPSPTNSSQESSSSSSSTRPCL